MTTLRSPLVHPIRRVLGACLLLLVSLGAVVLLETPSFAGFVPQAVTHAYVQGTSTGQTCPKVAAGAESTGCSLASAVNITKSGGTVYLETPGAVATYPGGITVNQSILIIPGEGVDTPVIDGGRTTRLFTLANDVSFEVRNTTLQNGVDQIGGGGAILAPQGNHLKLDHVVIKDNQGWDGGAVLINGTSGDPGSLEITDSTVSGNSSANEGGAIDAANYGGHVAVKITRSTFTDNTGPYSGGAIAVGTNSSSYGTLEVRASTFTGNMASQNGGAISVGAYNGDGAVLVLNSTFVANGWNALGSGGQGILIAGSVVANSVPYVGHGAQNCAGTPTDGGYNLEWGSNGVAADSCGFGGSATGHAPRLNDLADNGGATQTFLPTATSPLLKAIPADATINSIGLCAGPDQRGVALPSTQPCAIGSVQPLAAAPILESLTPNPDGTLTATWSPGTGPASLPLEHYVVTLEPGGATCVTTETSCVLRGLSATTHYNATLVATNAAGDSLPAAGLAVTTGLAATGAPVGVLGFGALLILALGIVLLGIRRRPAGR